MYIVQLQQFYVNLGSKTGSRVPWFLYFYFYYFVNNLYYIGYTVDLFLAGNHDRERILLIFLNIL